MSATVLVTGASRGLGLAMVAEFLGRGCRVIATARRPNRSSALVEWAIRTPPDRFMIIPMDVTNSDSVRVAACRLAQTWGALDILVNNAGVHPEEGSESFREMDPDWFSQAFATNVAGVVRCCQAFLPLLQKSVHPRIVNLSSGAGSVAHRDNHRRYAYGASKAALNHLTRSLAHELREANPPVAVTALSPGWVRTDMGGSQAELSMEEVIPTMVRTILDVDMGKTDAFLDRKGREGVYRW